LSLKLTPKQKLFCKYYLISLNATDAAIKAGYSKKTANRIGTENLSKPVIREYLESQMKSKEQELDISVDRILKELASIAFLDISEFYNEDGTLKNIKEINETARRAIQSVTTREEQGATVEDGEIKPQFFNVNNIKANDKLKALELLGKYHSIFKDKIEHSFDEKIENWLRGGK
jgi:phage terminase small subunit